MFQTPFTTRIRLGFALSIALSGLGFVCSPHTANAKACSAETYSTLRGADPNKGGAVEINCDLTLAQGDIISKDLIFSGVESSGSVLDCNGATIDGSQSGKETIIIRSTPQAGGTWSVPTGITIRNCTINGGIRMLGMMGDQLLKSSLERGHTQRVQLAAPSNITITGVTFTGKKATPLFVANGTQGLSVTGSKFIGNSNGTAIYLDAESANNTISHNTFDITTKNRELIAVDGSAHNTISDNTFQNPVNGGIFLYRNCGERGVIRHQPPQNNTITGNTFRYTSSRPKPAIWLDSRQGKSSFCFTNPAYPFGSSLSNLDFAKFNTVSGNKLPGGNASLIRNDDPTNKVSSNR